MEKHLHTIAGSYDKAIELGRQGIDLYQDLPAFITQDPDYPGWKEQAAGGDSSRKEIRDYLAPEKGMQFVDLGCCLNLMFYGYDKWPSVYNGVDISSKTIELLNDYTAKRHITTGSLVCASIQETPYADDRFAIGACIGVLEYFETAFVKEALREIHRIMKPDGRFVLDIPDSGDPIGRLMGRIEAYLGRPDRFDMTPSQFEELLRDYFIIEKAEEGPMRLYYLKCVK